MSETIDVSNMTDVPGFDETDMDMIRRGDMLGPRLGARAATALEALAAERDALREALLWIDTYEPELVASAEAKFAFDLSATPMTERTKL